MSGYNTISSAHGGLGLSTNGFNKILFKKPYKRNQSPPGKSAACVKGNHDGCFKLNCTCDCNHPTK